ncbi:MAG TPA: hypothetical protein VHE81_02300 [Lacipirellulaceae bacterium]|nr:hypothetical protein [Lacipirellulaceae bacterium]
MNQREKILAGAVVALAALWAGNYYFGLYSRTMHKRQADLDAAHTRLDAAENKLRAGRDAVKQVQEWDKQSLPADPNKAQSLYKAWLLAKANDAGLAVRDIVYFPPTSSSTTAYKAIGYRLSANGSLSSVIGMLYSFYHSSQLHQITRLQLSRPPGASQLAVNMDVEALSLPGAVATDKLPDGDSKRLKLASVDDYTKSFAERNIVTAYMPPRPPEPVHERHESPPKPKFDESEFAMFSGVVSSDKGMQAWILVRTTGETLHLVAGDEVKVGTLEGKIIRVEPRALVYSSGDKQFRVPLGDSLRKGKEIGADGAAKETAATNPKS